MRTHGTALVTMVGIAFLGSLALGGPRMWPPLPPFAIGDTGGKFSTKTLTASMHKGTHSMALERKYSSIHVIADTTVSERKTTDDGKEYIENYFIRAYTETPFRGKIHATSKRTFVRPAGGGIFFASEAHAEKDWVPSKIVNAENKWRTIIGGDDNVWGEDEGEADTGVRFGLAAHDIEGTSTDVSGTALDADLIAALVSDLRTGGWLLRDAAGDIQLDGNGDILWDTPPAISIRVTSSVSSVSGGGVEYTYRIDNYTDAAYSFHLADVTTPTFPSGWSGNVDADGHVEISYVDSGSEDIYSHQSQSTYTDGDGDEVMGAPVDVYVPAGRKGYSGSVGISSVTQTGPTTNAIRFVISGETAEGAVVIRDMDGAGVPRVVSEMDGPLLPDTEYLVIDDAAEPGAHSYRVRVGVKINSATSETVHIVNQ